MSAFPRFAPSTQMDESELRLIEAEAERVGTQVPFGLHPTPCPVPSLPNAFAVQHTLEWSTSMSPKTRNLEDLRAWVLREIRGTTPDLVNTTDKVSRHIGAAGSIGEINALIDGFLNRLNHAIGFVEDGLSLLPGDVPSNPTINQLLKAIVSDYERREIEVIL